MRVNSAFTLIPLVIATSSAVTSPFAQTIGNSVDSDPYQTIVRSSWLPAPGVVSEDGLTEFHSNKGVLNVTLTAQLTEVQLGETKFQATPFNGDYAGPVFRLRRGDTIKLRLNNQLRSPMNLHFHGLGCSPLPPADDVLMLVAPGEHYEYALQIPTQEESGLFWFHSHDHGSSQRQVMNGMSGTIVIEGQLDPFPQLKDIRERIIVLKDTIVDKNGFIPRDFDLSEPIIRTVNGKVNPTFNIHPGEVQFWRVVNESANLYYKLSLEGHQLQILARDAMRTTQLLPVDAYLLPPASRVEFLVVGGSKGTYHFSTADLDTGTDGDQYKGATLATMICDGDPIDSVPLPTPDQFPALDDAREKKVDNTRTYVFSENAKTNRFYINGKEFDATRVDTRVPLGQLEEWTFKNETNELHVFHIHQIDYQVTAINGESQEFTGYRDTVNVDAGSSITMLMPFDEMQIAGRFVYHCHLLEHEDSGMMAVIEVYDPEQPDEHLEDFYTYVPHLPALEIDRLAGTFSLTDHQNKNVTEADFAEDYSLVTFGYTTCNGTCATAVPNMVRAASRLRESGIKLAPYVVSVDPKRDSVATMADYVGRFGDGLIGLTGSPEDIERAATAFGVLYKPRPLDGENSYTILHSPEIFLLAPDGRFVGSFLDTAPPEEIIEKVRQILGTEKVAHRQ